MTHRRWSAELRRRFGCRVQKVSLDLGSGCPNRQGLSLGGCLFCDASGGGNGAWLRGESLDDQIRRGVVTARDHYKARACILYFQSYSVTYGPFDRFARSVRRALTIAQDYMPVVGLSVGTRPDLVSPEVVDFLSGFCAPDYEVWLELGVQTVKESHLAWLRRGHGLDAVVDALERTAESPLSLCAHLISGFPGEAEDQLLTSARWALDRGVTGLKFHPLHVLRGSALEDLYGRGAYIPLDLETYARRVASVLRDEGDRFVTQRLTADAREPRLVAPLWVARKDDVLRRIDELAELDNSDGDEEGTV